MDDATLLIAAREPTLETAADLHRRVPPDWYFRSIRENAFQRFWHRRRFREVRKLIEPTRGRILDVGCADGVFTNVIREAAQAEEAIGMDALEESVDWANRHWRGRKGLSFRVGDAHALPFRDGHFDAAFAMEVLEHVVDPLQALREIRRVLRPGGYAVLLVPSDNLLFRIIWWGWTRTRGRIWDDTHIQSFRGDTLPGLAREAGLALDVDRTFLLGMLHVVKARKLQ